MMIRIEKEMRRRRLGHAFFALVTLALFAWNVERFYFISDDGYICFRYAENAASGLGLVYNAGERVEGYTQFLWVLALAAGTRLGLDPELVGSSLGIASGLGLLAAMLLLGRRLGIGPWWWPWVVPLALASNRTFGMWCTSGLGTQFFACLVVLSSLAFQRERRSASLRPIASSLLFALTTLARPEGGLFFCVAAAIYAWDLFRARTRTLRSALWWTIPYVLIVLAHVLWRWRYYGDWLPNTFYAKVSGFWWEQSSLYLQAFAREHKLLYLAPLAFFFFVRHTAGPVMTLFGLQIIAYTGYLIYIGGDFFEFRFMTPVLPQLYWVLAELARRAATVAMSGFSSTAMVHVTHGFTAAVVATSAFLPSTQELPMRDHVASWNKLASYARTRAWEGQVLRQLIDQGYLDPKTRIAVRGAGALPYFSRLPTLDLHGLTDTRIARTPIKRRGIISHEKWATPEYLEEKQVVMIDIHNQLVFDAISPRDNGSVAEPHVERRFYTGPSRIVRAQGSYLVFGTTLTDQEFRQHFARFEIIR